MTPEWVGAIIAIVTAVITCGGAALGAAIAWTRNTEQLKQVRIDVRTFRAWHTGQIGSLSGKQHQLRDEVQDQEVRLAVVEALAGIPRAVPKPTKRDWTPVPVDVPWGGRDPEDSGAK